LGRKNAPDAVRWSLTGTVIVAYQGVNDARYKQATSGEKQTDWTHALLVLGGFDLQTGKRKWLCKPDKGGFRLMNCRIGYAVIENNPRSSCHSGRGLTVWIPPRE